MKIGTKSILFGCHQFALHPLLVWLSWKYLYGRAPTLRQTIAIVLHDIGYAVGCATMDGPDGERHPVLGARIATRILGEEYGRLVRYHSRSLAQREGAVPSELCAPDKMSFLLYPRWLYLLLGSWSGEIAEYKERMNLSHLPDSEWFAVTAERALHWAESNCPPEHRDRLRRHFGQRLECMRTALPVGQVAV